MSVIESQIIGHSVMFVQQFAELTSKKHQMVALLAFLKGIHQWPVVPLTKGQSCGKRPYIMTSSSTRIHNTLRALLYFVAGYVSLNRTHVIRGYSLARD